jgi:hypothetical protein
VCCARNNKKFLIEKKYVFVYVGVSDAEFTYTSKICPIDLMIFIPKVLFEILDILMVCYENTDTTFFSSQLFHLFIIIVPYNNFAGNITLLNYLQL